MYKVKTIVLPEHYTLMDVAYIYTWKRDAPMRFFYRVRSHQSKSEEVPEVPLTRTINNSSTTPPTTADKLQTDITPLENDKIQSEQTSCDEASTVVADMKPITTIVKDEKVEQVSEVPLTVSTQNKTNSHRHTTDTSVHKVKEKKSKKSKRDKCDKEKEEKGENIKLIIDLAKQTIKSETSSNSNSPSSSRDSFKSDKIKIENKLDEPIIKIEAVNNLQKTPEKLMTTSNSSKYDLLELDLKNPVKVEIEEDSPEKEKEKSDFLNSFELKAKKSLSPQQITPTKNITPVKSETVKPQNPPSLKITLSKRKLKDPSSKSVLKKTRSSPDGSKDIVEYKIKETSPPISTIQSELKAKKSPSYQVSYKVPTVPSVKSNKSPNKEKSALRLARPVFKQSVIPAINTLPQLEPVNVESQFKQPNPKIGPKQSSPKLSLSNSNISASASQSPTTHTSQSSPQTSHSLLNPTLGQTSPSVTTKTSPQTSPKTPSSSSSITSNGTSTFIKPSSSPKSISPKPSTSTSLVTKTNKSQVSITKSISPKESSINSNTSPFLPPALPKVSSSTSLKSMKLSSSTSDDKKTFVVNNIQRPSQVDTPRPPNSTTTTSTTTTPTTKSPSKPTTKLMKPPPVPIQRRPPQPILPKPRPDSNSTSTFTKDMNKMLNMNGAEIKKLESDKAKNTKVYGPSTSSASSSDMSSSSNGFPPPLSYPNSIKNSGGYLNYALMNSTNKNNKASGLNQDIPFSKMMNGGGYGTIGTPRYTPNSPIYSPNSPQYTPNYNIPTQPTYKYMKPPVYMSNMMQNLFSRPSSLATPQKPGSPPTPSTSNSQSSKASHSKGSQQTSPQMVSSTKDDVKIEKKENLKRPHPQSPTNSEDNVPEKQKKVQSLLDSCNINLPSSLSITITNDKDAPVNPIFNKKAGSPVNNYIEILKLNDNNDEKTSPNSEGIRSPTSDSPMAQMKHLPDLSLVKKTLDFKTPPIQSKSTNGQSYLMNPTLLAMKKIKKPSDKPAKPKIPKELKEPKVPKVPKKQPSTSAMGGNPTKRGRPPHAKLNESLLAANSLFPKPPHPTSTTPSLSPTSYQQLLEFQQKGLWGAAPPTVENIQEYIKDAATREMLLSQVNAQYQFCRLRMEQLYQQNLMNNNKTDSQE